MTAAAEEQRLVVILDGFPSLARSTRGLEGILQRWWDGRGRTSCVMLVLCGSDVAFMQGIVGAAGPLHRRATATIHVAPLDYRSAGRFVGELAPAERAVVYGILGGTPQYLTQWDARVSRRTNLLRLFGTPAGPLVDAAELVLLGELPEPQGTFRILQAIAHGRTRFGEIADYARVAVERPLKRLTTLGILERRVPALDNPTRTKRAIYRFIDPYFAFWFRFIAPNRAQIARGLGIQLVDGRILPELDDFMGTVFREMACEHARLLAAAGELEADRVESWWSPDGAHEIGVVGVTDRGTIGFVGAVTWPARPIGRTVLEYLEGHAGALPGFRADTRRLLYSRFGRGSEIAATPSVRCYSVEDLYA